MQSCLEHEVKGNVTFHFRPEASADKEYQQIVVLTCHLLLCFKTIL